jgi:cytochrome P450
MHFIRAASTAKSGNGIRHMVDPQTLLSKARLISLMIGSIIRIGAREVHVDDAKFFYQLHRCTQNIEKDKSYYIAPTALVSAHSREEHRRKRNAIESFYNPAAASGYEERIASTLVHFCKRLQMSKDINLSDAYRAWTFDTMCSIYLDYDPGLRTMDDFGRQTHLAYRDFTRFYTLFCFVPKVVTKVMTNVLQWEWLLPRQARLRLNFVSVRSERLKRR